MRIDTATDFTLDTPHYWDNFWNDRGGLGVGGGDPDSLSKILQSYHQTVWSRTLPCGEKMELQRGTGPNYLTWRDFRFGSDSIIVSFRYEKYRYMLDEVKKAVPDYKAFVEDYLHRAYTIGGMMIFPKHTGSINQAKGTNKKLCDRWDLTLECIRRYYAGEDSPISNTLLRDKEFFDLFVDFKGFVDTCYPDQKLKTLTIDVGFYISRYYSQKDAVAQADAEWFPATYSPGFSVDDWVKLLNDSEVFTTGSLEIMKRILGVNSYGTPQAIPGAVSISLDAEGESSPFYADGIYSTNATCA